MYFFHDSTISFISPQLGSHSFHLISDSLSQSVLFHLDLNQQVPTHQFDRTSTLQLVICQRQGHPLPDLEALVLFLLFFISLSPLLTLYIRIPVCEFVCGGFFVALFACCLLSLSLLCLKSISLKFKKSFWFYSHLSPRLIQPSFDAQSTAKKLAQLPSVDMQKVKQSFALMHSDCADCKVTVPKHLHMQTGGFWMAAWLEHAACQLQTVEQVFFCSGHSWLEHAAFNHLTHQNQLSFTMYAQSNPPIENLWFKKSIIPSQKQLLLKNPHFYSANSFTSPLLKLKKLFPLKKKIKYNCYLLFIYVLFYSLKRSTLCQINPNFEVKNVNPPPRGVHKGVTEISSLPSRQANPLCFSCLSLPSLLLRTLSFIFALTERSLLYCLAPVPITRLKFNTHWFYNPCATDYTLTRNTAATKMVRIALSLWCLQAWQGSILGFKYFKCTWDVARHALESGKRAWPNFSFAPDWPATPYLILSDFDEEKSKLTLLTIGVSLKFHRQKKSLQQTLLSRHCKCSPILEGYLTKFYIHILPKSRRILTCTCTLKLELYIFSDHILLHQSKLIILIFLTTNICDDKISVNYLQGIFLSWSIVGYDFNINHGKFETDLRKSFHQNQTKLVHNLKPKNNRDQLILGFMVFKLTITAKKNCSTACS
ncbi:hypothetical protein VP01_2862g1 [Puccinia sorghi]|uniref:Uncharacterized protein n=1 Tax=Puccinia sorghi TaxID=27349 RepID=A0A0L6V1W6_9BASI|nr:hypothetical protein VP01_2862g1 [Puccinia sorghi]